MDAKVNFRYRDHDLFKRETNSWTEKEQGPRDVALRCVEELGEQREERPVLTDAADVPTVI